MPSLVPSRRSHSTSSESTSPDGEPSRAASSTTRAGKPSKTPQVSGSKLTITSKRSVEESESRSASKTMRSVSGNKRRKVSLETDREPEDSQPDNNEEEEDEDENEVEDDGEEGEELRDQRKSKPAVENGNGTDAAENDEAEDVLRDLEVDDNREIVIPTAEDYESDDSEGGMANSLDTMKKNFEETPYAPGAILRVDLENFVTYTRVTFEPGPSLNMVIGPNGTGKSSLVCAICLGLGFGPEHLGRANDVAEFVKNGSDSAVIEIELMKNPEDEINPTFKRRINRDGSGGFWFNGKKISLKAASQLTKSMNIQIDNLCQFLPQDRVVEFAKLDAVALLKETQRAAAPPEVLKDHDTLKKLHSKEVEVQTTLDTDQQAMVTMENRQKILERDVERLRERERLQERITLMRHTIKFRTLLDMKGSRATLKEEHGKLRKELNDILKEEKPQADQIEAAEATRDGLKQWVKEEQGALEAMQADLRKEKDNGIGQVKRKEKEAETSRKAIFENEKTRKKNIESSKAKITRYQKTLENDPGQFDPTEFNERIEAVSRQIREMRPEEAACRASIEPMQNRGDEKQSEIAKIKKWLSNMENEEGRRLGFLNRTNLDAHRVYMWLQENKGHFKETVYGPPLLECNVVPNYQNEVDSLMRGNDATAFTCTNKEDFDKLMLAVYGDGKGQRGMGVSSVTIRYTEKKLADLPRIAPAELARFQLEGVALDFIKGPDPVLSMLCQNTGLHRIGISRQRLSPEQQTAIKDSRIMSKWISGGVCTSVVRRAEYNSETEVNTLVQQAKWMKPHQVDRQKISEAKGRLAELEDDLAQIKEAMRENSGKLEQLQNRRSELVQEKDELTNKKADKQKEYSQFHQAKLRLETEEEKLKKWEEEGDGFKDKLADLEVSMVQLNMERVEAAAIYAEHVREYVARYEALVISELHLIEACSNYHHYNGWNDSFKERKEAKQREISDAKTRYIELAEEIKEKHNECQAIVNSLSNEQQEVIRVLHEEKTIDDLKSEIHQEEVRLASIHEGNPHAIRQYEIREKEIKQLREQMNAKQAHLDKYRAAIIDVRGRWEPRIDKLVSNISEAFSRSFEFIGCAGAVRIRKEGKDGCEYENWAIEILVKFREEEQMQALNAQRQSGGERAVSTVFYLMALQSLARAPFRVVDEINQGMDPRNERLVHRRMVKIACKKHTSQYFLITPKLLVDLDYHERMKILCINSGDWVAEGHVQDFKRYINAGRKLMATA